MVHLPHASVNLTTVVRSIRLKLTACRAPGRASVLLADKNILGVKALETSRVQLERLPSSMGIHASLQVHLRLVILLRVTSFPRAARLAMAFAARALGFPRCRLGPHALRAEREISRAP